MKKVNRDELRSMILAGKDVTQVDVSGITDMSNLFSSCIQFNQDISGWDVSNVTNMSSMFFRCNNFNQDISKWDVSNVKNMSYMFEGCENFNQDISGWDVPNVKYMFAAFYNCPAKFNLKFWNKRTRLLNNLKKGWTRGRRVKMANNKKLKECNLGKIRITKDGINKTIDKIQLSDYLKNGWKRGISSMKSNKNAIIINNGKKEKWIYKDKLKKYLKTGWKKGRIVNKKTNEKIRKANLNKIKIYKDGINKTIDKTDLEFYQNAGWKRGFKTIRSASNSCLVIKNNIKSGFMIIS